MRLYHIVLLIFRLALTRNMATAEIVTKFKIQAQAVPAYQWQPQMSTKMVGYV